MFKEMSMLCEVCTDNIRKSLTPDFFIKHIGFGVIIAAVITTNTHTANQYAMIFMAAMFAIAYPIARSLIEDTGKIALNRLPNTHWALKFTAQITIEILQIIISVFLLVFTWPLIGLGILAVTDKTPSLQY